MDGRPHRPGWFARAATPQAAADGVLIDSDIPYGRRPAQRLDVYRAAAQPAALRPVLVLVHGGAWAMGDKANPGFVAHKAAHWVARGWIVVSVNYRLLPWGGPREQADDVAQALQAVHGHVARWGGDAGRIALLGHSTGAHLAALVLAEARPAAPVRRAVLMDSAALDIVAVMQGPHLPLHDRAFGADPAAWPGVSPWHRVAARLPPLLLVASAHRPESLAQSERFAERVRAFGGEATVQSVDLRHAEINEQLGQPGALTDGVEAFLAPLEPQG